MITGSCLCGGVRFEIERVTGPFELCHCNRCRKVSGSAFVAGLAARTADFRLVEGAELIRSYEAPILHRPPAYRHSFCSRCGSSVPDPASESEHFEVPAGTLDVDPVLCPDKHIFVELNPPWHELSDDLPKMTRQELVAHRTRARESEGD